jgi:hypothetical protein
VVLVVLTAEATAAGLERGPLNLVRINEDLLERKSSGSGVENRR